LSEKNTLKSASVKLKLFFIKNDKIELLNKERKTTNMKRLFTLFILSLFVLSACANTAKPSDSMNNNVPREEVPVQEPTSKAPNESTPQAPDQSQENENTEPTSDTSDKTTLAQQDEDYQIESVTLILEALNTAITLPQIDELSNSSLVATINEALSEAANSMTQSLDGSNPVTIEYTIKHQSPRLLSILYTGQMSIESGTITFLNPINIYIPTGSVINSESLLSSNAMAQTKFNQIFASHALDSGYDFETPEPWMGFYFSGDQMVYFFKETDLSETYDEIRIPLEEVKPYFNPLFDL
jgi:hypothetical protein